MDAFIRNTIEINEFFIKYASKTRALYHPLLGELQFVFLGTNSNYFNYLFQVFLVFRFFLKLCNKYSNEDVNVNKL